MKIADAAVFLDHLLRDRDPSQDAGTTADIINQLIWYFVDEGAAIRSVLKDWADSAELDKVAVVLEISSHFPKSNRLELAAFVRQTAGRWPHLSGKCDALLVQWDRQFPVDPSRPAR